MLGLILPVALTGYFVLAVAFLLTVQRSKRYAMWLGLAAIAAAAPFFLVLGGFSERYISGQCYSRAIDMIANAVESTDAPPELARELRALPLRGYETVCSEVEEASGLLPHAAP